MSVVPFLRAEAEGRQAVHERHGNYRPGIVGDCDLIGMSGEWEFARVARQPLPPLREDERGDDGIDFTVPIRFTVDVKTFRKPYNLIQPQGKASADIYVLAEYLGETRARLLGWESGQRLRSAPVREFGLLNHYIPRHQLRPMDDLLGRIMRLA